MLFLFFILPFKGTSLLPAVGYHVNLVYYIFFIIGLYSAACFSSLLLKNSLPAIICTPFILLFGILLISPLAVVLFLVSSSVFIFALSTISVLAVVFVIFSFLTWQKAIVKDVSPVKIIFSTAIAVLLVSFAIHAIANLAATQKLNKTIQQAKAEGIKLTLQEIIPSPVPDKDNAAVIYQRAFDFADRLAAKYKKEREYMPYEGKIPIENLTPAQKNTISKIMKDQEFINLYALIERAVNLPSCRFDLKYEEGPAMLLPHLAKMRRLAKLTAARTYILIYQGRYKESLESAKTGLLIGDSLANEPILISQLVRIAMDQITTESFQPLFDNFSYAISIKDYQNIISEIDKKDKYVAKGLEGVPPLIGSYSFRFALGEIDIDFDDINARFSTGKKITDFADFMSYESSGTPWFYWKLYGSYLGRPILKEDYIFYIQSFSTLMELSQKPYFSVKNEISKWESKPLDTIFTKPKHPISSMTLPALSRVLTQQARYNAILDTFKLALALKIYKQKHGYYPDMLISLFPEVISQLPLDPFTGKDYIYRKEGRGFILYSIGRNEHDDNGVYDQKQLGKYDDIAWKVSN
ncbi:MAG: hypothetical protein ABII89_03110 [Candidatus Omnitrophota bacterium]